MIIDSLTCPPCAGKKVPDKLASQIIQKNFVCPKCERRWIYKVKGELEVSERIPTWYYVSNQHNRAVRTDAI